MIRTATLDESMKAQRDHLRRCKEMVSAGIIANPANSEEKSYSDVVALIPELTNPTILDLGCQALEAYRYLLAKMPDMDYIGVEILPELVEEMKSIYPNLNIMQGYAEKLPLEDNSVDVVWARHVLEHVVDINLVFDELKRVMKPNGIIAFTVPCGVHGEPAHFLEIERPDWEVIFSNNGFDLHHPDQHDFNLNEFYGILTLNAVK